MNEVLQHIFWKHIWSCNFFFQPKTFKISPSLTLVENLPCSWSIYFLALFPIIPCVFCFSYSTLFIISGTHPMLTNAAFPHLHIFVQDIPSAWIPFPSLPIKFQLSKYLSFKTQLKCNLHKDSPDSHPNFPNSIISSSSKHQNIQY